MLESASSFPAIFFASIIGAIVFVALSQLLLPLTFPCGRKIAERGNGAMPPKESPGRPGALKWPLEGVLEEADL
jgi:hypothetical protein